MPREKRCSVSASCFWSVSAPAPTQDNRRVFFFKIDRKWKEAHAQYAGDYGVMRYRDENGGRKPDFPD